MMLSANRTEPHTGFWKSEGQVPWKYGFKVSFYRRDTFEIGL